MLSGFYILSADAQTPCGELFWPQLTRVRLHSARGKCVLSLFVKGQRCFTPGGRSVPEVRKSTCAQGGSCILEGANGRQRVLGTCQVRASYSDRAGSPGPARSRSSVPTPPCCPHPSASPVTHGDVCGAGCIRATCGGICQSSHQVALSRAGRCRSVWRAGLLCLCVPDAQVGWDLGEGLAPWPGLCSTWGRRQVSAVVLSPTELLWGRWRPARRSGPGALSCPRICAGCRGRAAATSSFADSPLFLTGFPTPSACCGITFPGNCMPLVLGIGDEMGWPPGRGHLLGTGHPCSPKKAQHVTPSAPGPRRKDSRHGCSLCC